MTGTSLADPLPIAFAAALGLVLGLAYFRLLRRSVERLAAGRGPAEAAVLALARVAAAVLVLWWLAGLGAPALLAGALGFLLARALALRSARRAGP
jgi:F1F0 ATPase subunit 2